MQIIDNKGKTMAEVINNLMPASEALYFRTGYFFFSGYKEIYKNLKNKKIKILVGKDIQRDLAGIVQELDYQSLKDKSKSKIRLDYYKSLVSTFSDVNQVDNKETQEAYEVFKEKILNGTLEVRKSLEPDHSKVYLFENSKEFNQNGEYLGAVLKGSSNLTFSGLVGQNEENELRKENDEFNYYKQKFEELWETSVELIAKDYLEDFKNHVLSNIWPEQLPDPYSVYIRVLFEYLSLNEDKDILTPTKITKEKIDLKYQIDAIRQALNIIEKHNGVIIADVVGLGKSIIASCIAKNLDKKTIIISPPHLLQQWEDYRYEFRFDAKVYGSGSVLKAIEENDDDEAKLIIVDEAHKFRNEEKSMYANLHRLCKGNKVVLLTATPFNNNPKDIFALIKLFQIPAKSTIQTIDNLSLRFKELIKQYNQIRKIKKEEPDNSLIGIQVNKLATNIKDFLGPLLIRRSRLDLMEIDLYKRDLEAQGISFPKVNSPQPLKYQFGELESLYLKTLEIIVPEDLEEGFKGARYRITKYLKDEKRMEEIAKRLNIDLNLVRNTQENLAKFMKRLLVHRFESSVEAFRKTIDNMIDSYLKIEGWYSKGQVPIYKRGDLPDVEEFYEENEGDETITQINEALGEYENKGLELIDVNDLKGEFIADLKSDIRLLRNIKTLWSSFDPTKDPKIAEIKKQINRLRKENPQRKIVIFTIYSDTANYVFEQLKNTFKIFKYSAEDSSEKNKNIIKVNFDAGYVEKQNEYDLLIATDAISEGYNLHRAGAIFNYDIPYNPTRVIQRVGRINRINKKVFDEIFIYNFFPSPTGEKETGVKRISTLKIDVIKALLGDDTKYLTEDEVIKSYNTKFENEMRNTEDLSWDTKYKNLIFSLKNTLDMDLAFKIPMRTKIKRTIRNGNSGVLVFGRKGVDYTFKLSIIKGEDNVLSITAAEAIKLFEASKDERAVKVSDGFYEIYENLKKNLFVRKSEVPKDKALRASLDKIEEIKGNMPDYRDYFDDLEFVMKDLGDLPGKFAKSIRDITKENLKKGVEDLRKEVPHEYLLKIIEESESIGEGKESLILAEEF